MKCKDDSITLTIGDAVDYLSAAFSYETNGQILYQRLLRNNLIAPSGTRGVKCTVLRKDLDHFYKKRGLAMNRLAKEFHEHPYAVKDLCHQMNISLDNTRPISFQSQEDYNAIRKRLEEIRSTRN